MNNLENRWQYQKVSIELIDDADMNANSMTEQEFATLCDNIGISGLSSVPTCYKKEDGRYTLISGHHRIKACRKLNYKEVGILYVDESDLTNDERIAIQLSHNSLHGSDDASILKKLFSQIKTIEFKKFAHIEIDEIGNIDTSAIAVIPMKETYSIGIILYQNSKEAFDELVGDIREMSKKSDVLLLADGDKNEDTFMSLQEEIRSKYEIKSTSVAFAKILELAKKQLYEEHNQ